MFVKSYAVRGLHRTLTTLIAAASFRKRIVIPRLVAVAAPLTRLLGIVFRNKKVSKYYSRA